MIRTLRRRFILFAMSAVTVLLVILVLAISGFSYMMFDRQSDRMLEALAEGEGGFRPAELPPPAPFAPQMNLDTMMSLRYFTVFVDANGAAVEPNLDRISAVDQETAIGYAQEARLTGARRGRIDNYKYLAKDGKNGSLYFFMDISDQQNSCATVAFASAAIAAACWLSVLVFVILFSGKAVKPVAENMDRQKQFITNAGHELKTPLSIIQSNNDAAELLLGGNKYSANIRTQVKRMNTLVSHLLTLSKLDEAALPAVDTCDLSEILTNAVREYRDAAAAGNIGFRSHIRPGVMVRANRELLEQLVSILLDNAVKYTPPGGEIMAALSQNGQRCILQCENDCMAAKNRDAERLFERFYRGDQARTQEEISSGYGIGLSAARAICESMKGSLHAAYLSETRICFTARLPANPVQSFK